MIDVRNSENWLIIYLVYKVFLFCIERVVIIKCVWGYWIEKEKVFVR